jgi:hypothetical protein
VRSLFVLLPTLAHAQHATPVVTKALMRDIAAGKVPAARLVDPDIGVVVIDYVAERDPVARSSRRLCGSAAESHLRDWVKTHLRPAVALDELFACTTLPDGTLVIDTLITTDATSEPKDRPLVVARLREKQLGGRCER